MNLETYAQDIKKTSMLYWYPIVKDLDIPQPKTEIVEIPYRTLTGFLDGLTLKEYEPKILEAIQKVDGYPVFMRTDHSSAKHAWSSTCFVDAEVSLWRNIWNLVDHNGMNDLPDNALIFRRFLDLEVGFTAFHSKFPVSKEFRCFIKNGELQCIHPYWFDEVMESQGRPTDKNWRTKLAELNRLSPEDMSIIKGYLKLVCGVFKDYWSVDFAKGVDGKWYLTDMAAGDVSYHYPKCQFSEDKFQ